VVIFCANLDPLCRILWGYRLRSMEPLVARSSRGVQIGQESYRGSSYNNEDGWAHGCIAVRAAHLS
jgi:hypothetical protein